MSDVDWAKVGPGLLAAVERISAESIETFAINDRTDSAIAVEGSDRFAHERDVKRLMTDLRAAIAAAKGDAR